MKICTFAVIMKNLVMKIAVVLLTVWYCMSIIGFDVHTCKNSGRTFVATFIEGIACSDIHPEHHCCKCACSHHQDSKSGIDADECCTDDYQVITISGCRTEAGQTVVDSHFFDFNPALLAYCMPVFSADYGCHINLKSKHPESWDIIYDDICVIFNVFRI